MTAVRLIAYTPNGASLGPLPNPIGAQASYVLNDVGALSLTYHPSAARANLLGQPLEVATEVSYDGGMTWTEPANGRFLYLRDGRDPVKTDDAFAIEAPSYVKRLEKALVGTTGLDADGRRTYEGATPGAILNDLWGRAIARGALAGMTAFWSPTNDALGIPWPETQSISYDPGTSLLAVLLGMVEAGWVDFTMQGRTLQLFVAEGAGSDKTTGAAPVSLRFGRDLTEAPFRRTWEGLADTAVVLGDEGKTVTRVNPAALKPWGVQETYVSASGVTDDGTLSVLGDAALTYTEDVRAEHTFGLAFGVVGQSLPFRDYYPGDWVWAATDGTVAPERMRVRQITLTRDDKGAVGGNVVLNDRFLEADVLQARKIAKITGGATQGGNGTPPGGVGPDILAPKAPTGLTASSASYVTPDGVIRAQITLNWNDVTQNSDNTPAGDVAGYEVWARIPTMFDWRMVATTDVSQWTNSPYEPGQTWEFKVRAVDTSYNFSGFSATASTTTMSDFTPPPAPSTPTGTTRMGTARINWDGLNSNGAPMTDTPDWRYVTVHVSAVNGFTPDAGNRVGELAGAGYVVAGPLNYSQTYYARLVAYDSSGNASAASTQVALVVAPLVDVSNFPDDAMEELYARTGHFLTLTADNFAANLIEGAWIKAGTLTADLLTIGWAQDSLVLNGGFEDIGPDGKPLEWHLEDWSPNVLPNPDTGANTTGWTFANGTFVPSGTFGRFTVNAQSGVSGVHVTASEFFAVSAGETMEANVAIRSNGVARDFFISIQWYDATSYLSQSAGANTLASAATFTDLATATGTAPAGATRARILIRPTGALVTGNAWDQKAAVLKGAVGTWATETVSVIGGTKSARVGQRSRYGITLLAADRAFPVVEGVTYYCKASVRLNSALNAAATAPTLHLLAGTSDANATFFSNGQQVFFSAGRAANTLYTMEGTITIAAGMKMARPVVMLWAGTPGGVYSAVIDSVEFRPATPDSEITTVGAGKIRTGILQATERIIAGTLTGARAEMNGVGFQAFAPDGRKMFEVQANSGETVIGNPAGGNISLRLGAFTNPYTGVNQGLIRFVNAGTSWGDGQIVSQFETINSQATGSLRLSSPYNSGLANPLGNAAFLDLRSNAAGGSAFYLKAAEANFSGNTFIYGSGDGTSIDFRAFGTRTDGFNVGFTFMDFSGGSRLNLYPRAGYFLVRAQDPNSNAQGLRLQGSSVALSAGGQELFMETNGVQPALGHFERNLALEYNTNGAIRAVSYLRNVFIPLHASAFTVSSDPRAKSGAKPVKGALGAVRAVTGYDYDMEGILPRKAPAKPRTRRVKGRDGEKVDQVAQVANRARGVMADELRAVLPDAVHEDHDGLLSVSLYDMLTTAWAAIQELADEVDTLKASHPPKE